MPSPEGTRKRRGSSPRLFLSRLEELGGTPLKPSKRRPLGGLLVEMVKRHGVLTASIAEKVPLKEEIASALTGAGVRIEEDPSATDLGVTGVSAAVGRTGSMVFAFKNDKEHLLTSLPPVHLAVVEKGQIYPSLEEAMEMVLGSSGAPPAYISVVNGPSKTGDIELIHVSGVHGPQWVYAVVV